MSVLLPYAVFCTTHLKKQNKTKNRVHFNYYTVINGYVNITVIHIITVINTYGMYVESTSNIVENVDFFQKKLQNSNIK